MFKSKIFKVIASVLCFVLGVIVGGIGNIIYSAPDSYEIPAAVQANANIVAGEINVETVKNQDLSIHFLELGNKYTGDCTLIKVGDTEMLIDAGSKASSIPTIKAYLDKYVDGALDYVVVTHAHEDHYAGFATNENTDSLFDLYEVSNIIDFGDGTNKTTSNKMYANYVRERQQEIDDGNTNYARAIDYINNIGELTQRFELKAGSGVYVEMLYHKFLNKGNVAQTENDYSVCLQIVYEDKYYLFTGDLEADGEESLVDEHTKSEGRNKGMLHEVEVYKAGHHGSKTSSTETLMNIIKPKNVCVCCCAGSSEYTSKNENQFPTQEFINNVYAANPNAKIYVTTLCLDYKTNSFTSFNGNIVVYYSKTAPSITIACSNNTTDLKDTDWFKTNRTLPEASA